MTTAACVHTCVVCSDVSGLKFTDHTLLSVCDILRQSSADGQICSLSVQTQLLASLTLVLHSLPSHAGYSVACLIDSRAVLLFHLSCVLKSRF